MREELACRWLKQNYGPREWNGLRNLPRLNADVDGILLQTPLYVCAFWGKVSNSSTQCIAASPLKFCTLATFGAQTDLWDMKGKKFQQLLNMPTSCTTHGRVYSFIHVHQCFKNWCILQLLDGIGDKKDILEDLRHLECGGFTHAGVC